MSAPEDIDGVMNWGVLVHTVSGGGYDGVTANVRVRVPDDDSPNMLCSRPTP